MTRDERTPTPPFPPQHLEKPGRETELDPRPRYLAPTYRGSGKLDGRRALVTGGDSGIGRAVAVLFAREGAQLAITHLPEEREDAAETLRAVQSEGSAGTAIEVDLTAPDACERTAREAEAALGGLDLLVNNAAYQQHRGGLEDLDLQQWDYTFATNVRAYFRMTKAVVPRLPDGAAIINTGSVVGLEGKSALIDYAATKGAIHAFTKALAQDLAPRGIRVNCVAPGPVWTPLNPAERAPDDVRHFGAKQPFGRPAQPEEVAPSYVFFAAHASSSFISGEIMTLLGGGTRAA
jgi:NAD(P)-dependent dehydrogenase (short-subunit alcohol dehydrogenase family)